MLTQSDLQKMQQLLEMVVDVKIEPRLQAIEKRIQYLPTTDEYLTQADKIYGEIRAMRDEQAIMVENLSQIDDHEERLEKLETQLALG